MPAYATTVTCVVAVSSVIIFLIFYRMKILGFKTLLSITLASLISAIGLPFAYKLVSDSTSSGAEAVSPATTLLISVAAYLLIVVILSIIISLIINGAGIKHKKPDESDNAANTEKDSAEDDNYLEQIFVNFIGAHEQNVTDSSNAPSEVEETAQEVTETIQEAAAVEFPEAVETTPDIETADAGEIGEAVEAVLAFSLLDAAETPAAVNVAVYDSISDTASDSVSDTDGILTNIDENAAVTENNFEISVDSHENIDKMGIENIVHNRNSLTMEDCINEAFRLKGAGDFEGAILYHMYALDKRPDGELTFWIILDICVMYKWLGQQELALDILNSYYDTYGDTMDISVKDEIRRNLAAIQA